MLNSLLHKMCIRDSLSLQERMEWDLKRMDMIIRQLDNRKAGYTADDKMCIRDSYSHISNTNGNPYSVCMEIFRLFIFSCGKRFDAGFDYKGYPE